jgi:uncharacterized protein
MNWQWDAQKSQRNKQKHGLRFETALAVFDDAMCKSRLDFYPLEERWQTIGMIGPVCVIVIHTLPVSEDESGAGRIISARRATRHERIEYEEGRF